MEIKMTIEDNLAKSYSPTICVTHKCNLNCVYCYQQNKDNRSMSFEIARKCIDDIFSSIPSNVKTIELSFIGGEPLLEMELIKKVYGYTLTKYTDSRLHFFATTNGTVLTSEDKKWFSERKDKFLHF